jgi:hypothetical protein
MSWKSIASTRRGLVLLALAAAAAWQPAAAQRKIETDGPYAHRGAGAVYPVRVGDFVRSNVYQYDAEGKDVSASYNLMMPEGRLLITVYIYPAARVTPVGAQDGSKEAAQALLCDREFDSVNEVISSQHPGTAAVERGAALDVPGVGPRLGHRSVYRFRAAFDDDEQEIRSEAHLYCYVGGDWLVKYRVSAPAAVETRGPVESFIRNGPWPGRSSA